jgi:beta-glucanase (GH16 family)
MPMRLSWVLVGVLLLAGCDEQQLGWIDSPRPGQLAQALSARSVTLRAANGRFLSAENGGGGALTADRAAALGWETFTLIDKSDGALNSGDEVFLRAASGHYLQAINGGGGALKATGSDRLGWETFRILRSAGPGTINPGDQVSLQTLNGSRFVSANAGVTADATSAGGNERFTLEVLSPTTQGDLGGWRLVWADEFDGTDVDSARWSGESWTPYWVNNELQSYNGLRRENVRVENGQLVVEARRDFHNGHEYSSARIHTGGKAGWTYGRFEARMQLPSGWGTWPAFWMMPDDQRQGWPACGELDIMEHVGHDPEVVHGTAHSRAYNWKSPVQRTASRRVPGATTGFHTYAMEWSPQKTEVFVDGTSYFSSTNDGQGDDSWPFNKRFHLIFNLAVGGVWGGAKGVDPNVWPQQLRVDYARVYQR